MFVKPLAKNLKFLFTSPVLKNRRARSVTTAFGIFALFGGVLFVIPVPYATLAEGVVWLPESSMVRAGASGFVAAVDKAPNSEAVMGEALLSLEDPILVAKVKALEARVRQLDLVYQAQLTSDLVKAELTRQQYLFAQAGLDRAREEAAELVLVSPVDGRLILPYAEDLPGRYVTKGTVVGFVVEPGATTLQVVLSQDDIDLVRSRTQGVSARIVGDLDETLAVARMREIPAATETLPSRVLSTEGGGQIFLDPRDPSGGKALESVFQLELTLQDTKADEFVGRRAWVRFDHGQEPLPWRWFRSLRQLFLRQFEV